MIVLITGSTQPLLTFIAGTQLSLWSWTHLWTKPKTRKICSVQHLSTWTATYAASPTPDQLHSPGHKVNSVVSRLGLWQRHMFWKGVQVCENIKRLKICLVPTFFSVVRLLLLQMWTLFLHLLSFTFSHLCIFVTTCFARLNCFSSLN